MKKVILITDVDFWGKSSGHRARIATMVAFLAKEVKLTIIKVGPATENIEAYLRHSVDAEFFILEKNKFLNSKGYEKRLKIFLKDRIFDVAIIQYIHCSYFLNVIPADCKLVLDAHDIVSERTEEFRKFNYGGDASSAIYEISEKNEKEIFKCYDKVIAICKPDLDKIEAMIGPSKAILCPHPAVVNNLVIRPEVSTISFIASPYLPNIDAISFFVENCWQKIHEKYGKQLNIYGNICRSLSYGSHRNINLKGFIPNQKIIYEESDIIINPVRFGSGIKIKNIEALSFGLPLLTTSHGSRGIESGMNSAFLVADNVEKIIECVGLLIEQFDLRLALSEKSKKFVDEYFSVEKCFRPLLEAINE